MLKRMHLVIGAAALALCVGTGVGAQAQDQPSPTPPSPGASSAPGATGGSTMNMQDQNTGRRARRERANREQVRSSYEATGTSLIPPPVTSIDWSARFRLTPLDHKRLRAMGLTDEEVFMVANGAEAGGREVDDVAQMVLRGQTPYQISEQLNVPVNTLEARRPEWQTPEWDQAVRQGAATWYVHSSTMTSPAPRAVPAPSGTPEVPPAQR